MARNKPFGPRAGSRAYVALQFLKSLGSLGTADWMIHAAASKSVAKFRQEVIEPLKQWKLVESVDVGLYRITSAGHLFLSEPSAEPASQTVVEGRYVHPIQPLTARHRPPRPLRPGAFDYRDIPSRYADMSVPFKSSIKPENE